MIPALGCALAVAAQLPPRETRRLPDGRSQTLAILKADHEKNMEEAAELVRLSKELQKEIESGGGHVLSLEAISKTEKIEELAKEIRERLRRFH